MLFSLASLDSIFLPPLISYRWFEPTFYHNKRTWIVCRCLEAGPTSTLSSLFLPLLCCFCFGSLFLITPYHHHRQKASHNGSSNEDQNDWYSNCPDPWWEVGLQRMTLINEGLWILWNSESAGVSGALTVHRRKHWSESQLDR